MSAYTSPLSVEPLFSVSIPPRAPSPSRENVAAASTTGAMPPCYSEELHGNMRLAGTSVTSFGASASGSTLSRRIDRRKLKTKMCQYILRGRVCPFDRNCAFSHDINELTPNRMSLQSLASPTESEPLSPTTEWLRSPDSVEVHAVKPFRHQPYLPLFKTTTISKTTSTKESATGRDSSASGEEEDAASRSCNSTAAASLPAFDSVRSAASAPRPPSYEETIALLPVYVTHPAELTTQTRYRHNPYSFDGVIYMD